jgi:hypothetical protein
LTTRTGGPKITGMLDAARVITAYVENRHPAISIQLQRGVIASITATFSGAEAFASCTWVPPGAEEVPGLVGCKQGSWTLVSVEETVPDAVPNPDVPIVLPGQALETTERLGRLAGVAVHELKRHGALPGGDDLPRVVAVELHHAAFPGGKIRIDLESADLSADREEVRTAFLDAAIPPPATLAIASRVAAVLHTHRLRFP